MMKMKIYFITYGLLATLAGYASAQLMCPLDCSCPLDAKGRREVLCYKSNMTDPIPVLQMPSETEILVVRPPDGTENSLTLGPIFRGLKHLLKIYIVNSQIPAVGEHSFWGQKQLEILNISHNSITAILKTNFRGPLKLSVLDLSYNRIESAPSGVFYYLPLLQELNLSHNRLPVLVPRIFLGLKNLKALDLSFNPLGAIPPGSLSDLPKLTEFKCKGCGILAVKNLFTHETPLLESIDLSYNRLTKLPHVNGISSMSKIILKGNRIDQVNNGDFQNSNIKEVDLSGNRITSISENAFINTSIAHLDLSYNLLSLLEPKIMYPIISKLRLLDLSGNSIHMDQLKYILPKSKQLRMLNIADLGLTKLPSDLLRKSRHLRFLNVSSNYLTKFPPELLYSTPNLRNLDLSSNGFRGINHNLLSAFKAMPSLSSIRLERNPWICEECHVSGMIQWLKSDSKQTHVNSACNNDSSSVMCLKCVGPRKFAGKSMVTLTEEKLPDCTPIDESLVPFWKVEGQSEVFQRDDPKFRKRYPSMADRTEMAIVAAFFKDHIALIVGVGCGLVLALLLVVVTSVICSRQHSAQYYTSELEKFKGGSSGNNNGSPDLNTTDSGKISTYEPMAISKIHARTPLLLNQPIPSNSGDAIVFFKKKPSISTIHEIDSDQLDISSDASD